MNFVCSLNFVDVNILVYLVRRPCTAGIVSFNKKKYGTFKTLVINSEYSKSDVFKKLSVPAQILNFLKRGIPEIDALSWIYSRFIGLV